MPLGDSLTWGWDGNQSDLTTLNTGGYRSPLYQALGAQGVNVNYVGSSMANTGTFLASVHQTAHDGYNGYRIDDIANNLAASVPGSNGVSNSGGFWLTSVQKPNIILLQAGANDIEQHYDPLYTGAGTETAQQMGQDTATRMMALINQILAIDGNSWIFTDGTSPLENTTFADSSVYYYDTDLQSMIASAYGSSSSKHVIYVDMRDAIANNGFFSLYSAQGDGEHFSTTGYAVMGDEWASSIMADYNFADVNAVPEPSTWVLLLGGVVVLAGWRKLRRAE